MPYRESEWEKMINNMVELNTKVYWNIYDDASSSSWDMAGPVLVPNHDYRLRVSVKNTGIEYNFDKIQMRVVAKAGKMLLYDPGFVNPKNRIHVEFNDVKPKHWRGASMQMRVLEDIGNEEIFTIGVYGTIKPMGRDWSGWLRWPGDRFEDYGDSNP